MMIVLKVSLKMVMMIMKGMRLQQGGDNHVESLKASLFNWSEAGKLMAESRFWGNSRKIHIKGECGGHCLQMDKL